MKYLTPFSIIEQKFKLKNKGSPNKISMTDDELIALIKQFLQAIPVDETWYCKSYPDVAEAIAEKSHVSATQHFVEHGYFEGRQPYEPEVDEGWYVETNPDVRAGVEAGLIKSPRAHFIEHGYDEGRRPTQQA
jgi:hypothetical protein